MESLPDAIVQYILCHMANARDVATCTCVSKRWKDSMPYLKSLYFPRNSFDNLTGADNSDNVVFKMISSIVKLEQLVVYCPFSSAGLASWLSYAGSSLRHLELRMDNIAEHPIGFEDSSKPSKLDCIAYARNLESLKLWGVLMTHPPKWDFFQSLRNLEIVGARLEDPALSNALQACPNLTHLLLLGCEGVRSVSIELPHLEQCKLDFYGWGNCSLSVISPKLELLEVQGCSWIRVRETQYLRNLSIANNAGKILLDYSVSKYFSPVFSSSSWLRKKRKTLLIIQTVINFLVVTNCFREGLHGGFWKACFPWVFVNKRGAVVLGCNKQNAPVGKWCEASLYEGGIHWGFWSSSAISRDWLCWLL